MNIKKKKDTRFKKLPEKKLIDKVLDDAGIFGTFRLIYYAFARKIKSNKISSKEDLAKAIEELKAKPENCKEEVLKKIANKVRPELM